VSRIVVIQRILINYRKGFFDLLSEKIDYKLVCSDKSAGKIKSSKKFESIPYIYQPMSFKLLDSYIIFPFLFFSLYKLKPKHIITQGGQNTVNNFPVWVYCKLFNCEYTIWDLGKGYEKIKKETMIRSLYEKFYNFIMNDSVQIYTYNDRGIQYFKNRGFKKNIVSLKNTIDTREVEYVISNYSEKEQQLINEKFNKYKFHLLFVGVLNEKKRLEDFKKIMDMLPDEYGLIIVGSGDEKYVNKLKHLLDDERIYFEGYKNMDQLQYYYNHVDFLLLPGLGGLAINQAMAFGIPVVCTEADGIEDEIIINNETGYLYKTVEEAVEFILKNNKDSWSRMGANAKKLLFKDYTIEKMVDRFIKHLE